MEHGQVKEEKCAVLWSTGLGSSKRAFKSCIEKDVNTGRVCDSDLWMEKLKAWNLTPDNNAAIVRLGWENILNKAANYWNSTIHEGNKTSSPGQLYVNGNNIWAQGFTGLVEKVNPALVV